jgi:hypothetical protein
MKPLQQSYHSTALRQYGIALTTSLIFLVVMSALSVSMFRNISLQEKMAGNLRSQTSSFEAANSSIARNWSLPAWLGSTTNASAVDIKHYDIEDEFDIMRGTDKVVDLDVDVDICFAGEALASGFSWSNDQGQSKQLMAQRYQIQAKAQDTINTSANIDRAGYVVLPAGGHPANCP